MVQLFTYLSDALEGQALLALVLAANVGEEAALPPLGPRRLVVDDAVVRHQQGGHRIHQSGLAGADVAGQQRVAPGRIDTPDVTVEGAPIEHLEALQAEASGGVVGGEVELGGLHELSH